MKITLKNISNVNAFVEFVAECEGKIEAISETGERIDLKKKLTEITCLVNTFHDGIIDSIDLEVTSPEDYTRFFYAMMDGSFVQASTNECHNEKEFYNGYVSFLNRFRTLANA